LDETPQIRRAYPGGLNSGKMAAETWFRSCSDEGKWTIPVGVQPVVSITRRPDACTTRLQMTAVAGPFACGERVRATGTPPES
jgi:hypothetical protein